MIKFTNTLTGKKELFKSIRSDTVSLYVCGITPYDFAHVGHGRCYVAFDILHRMLLFQGYHVTYVRNFTDIDDKLLKRAQKECGNQQAYAEVAQRFIESYTQDMDALNCLPPTHEPRVTENIKEIIIFIQGLIDKGNAYVANGDVYFHIPTFADYTKLSKQKIEDLNVGARVEVSDIKKNPLDFALWKHEKEGTFWQSPWGSGRPGWHIECSALAEKYLGKHIDIHAGGMDLIFPHHENEIAQSESLHGQTFVNYWLHNAFVRINKEKMSKSLGNFFTLREVFKEFDPMVVRFYFINHYYRAPLDFSFDDLTAVQKSYQRLCRAFETVGDVSSLTIADIKESKTVNAMLTFLHDDMNTSGMLGVLFDHLGYIQKDTQEHARVKAFMVQVLGLTLEPLLEKKIEITPEIKKLMQEREQARIEKNWERADQIRDLLYEMGVDVQDKKLK